MLGAISNKLFGTPVSHFDYFTPQNCTIVVVASVIFLGLSVYLRRKTAAPAPAHFDQIKEARLDEVKTQMQSYMNQVGITKKLAIVLDESNPMRATYDPQNNKFLLGIFFFLKKEDIPIEVQKSKPFECSVKHAERIQQWWVKFNKTNRYAPMLGVKFVLHQNFRNMKKFVLLHEIGHCKYGDSDVESYKYYESDLIGEFIGFWKKRHSLLGRMHPSWFVGCTKHSRDEERRADLFAARFNRQLAKGGIDFFQLYQKEIGTNMPKYLTHPTFSERIAYLSKCS